jgi:hypothetical protein
LTGAAYGVLHNRLSWNAAASRSVMVSRCAFREWRHAEVSGKQDLAFTGFANLSAADPSERCCSTPVT